MIDQQSPALGRILAVDASPDVLFGLVAQLPRYSVMGVRNVGEALALSPQRFDVILAELPAGQDGQALKQALEERRVTTPVILMSDDPELAHAARAAGAFGFVRKPLDGQELEWVLRSAVSPLSGRPRTPVRPPSRQVTRRYDVEGLTGRVP
jgi:DNA-binding NtrC family response regulator